MTSMLFPGFKVTRLVWCLPGRAILVRGVQFRLISNCVVLCAMVSAALGWEGVSLTTMLTGCYYALVPPVD